MCRALVETQRENASKRFLQKATKKTKISGYKSYTEIWLSSVFLDADAFFASFASFCQSCFARVVAISREGKQGDKRVVIDFRNPSLSSFPSVSSYWDLETPSIRRRRGQL